MKDETLLRCYATFCLVEKTLARLKEGADNPMIDRDQLAELINVVDIPFEDIKTGINKAIMSEV